VTFVNTVTAGYCMAGLWLNTNYPAASLPVVPKAVTAPCT